MSKQDIMAQREIWLRACAAYRLAVQEAEEADRKHRGLVQRAEERRRAEQVKLEAMVKADADALQALLEPPSDNELRSANQHVGIVEPPQAAKVIPITSPPVPVGSGVEGMELREPGANCAHDWRWNENSGLEWCAKCGGERLAQVQPA